jgi:hypothetical protein
VSVQLRLVFLDFQPVDELLTIGEKNRIYDFALSGQFLDPVFSDTNANAIGRTTKFHSHDIQLKTDKKSEVQTRK